MGVGLSTSLSLMSLAVAAAVGVTQLLRWIQELRDRRALKREASTKSQAERDSIMIKGAEGVLLMMQGMLETTQASEKGLRESNVELSRRIRELETQNHALQQSLYDCEQHERGSDG